MAECEVTFQLGRAETVPGEAVLVVGGHRSLGGWDPSAGLRLVTDENLYPSWTGGVRLTPAAAGGKIEYKYVFDRQIDGNGFQWEEGENRCLTLPVGGGAWVQHDVGFGKPGSKLLSAAPLAAAPLAAAPLAAAPVAAAPRAAAPLAAAADRAGAAIERTPARAPPNPSRLLKSASSGGGDASSAISTSVGRKAAAAASPTTADAPSTVSGPPGVNNADDLPTTTEGSEASPEEKSLASDAQLMNVPSMVSVVQGNVMQRLASLSAFDQLIDDADQMAAMRAQLEAEAEKLEDRPVRYGARHLSTPIVIVASEMHPWSKTGGLAMIAGSYGYEFALRGHRTMAIAPMYDDYAECQWLCKKGLNIAGGYHEVQYFLHRKFYGHGKVCDYVFVDHPSFRRSEGIYGPPGGEYGDNLFRFALFSLAAAEAPLVLEIDGSTYGQDVLFICNDWQTGILPVYLLYKYKLHGTYCNARSMMVIHNIGYQGKYSKEEFPVDSYLGLSCRFAGEDLQGEDMHLGPDCINLLAGGVRTADRVLTVSPNYTNEIRSPEGGHGIHDLLEKRGGELRLAGILNGISDEWSPLTDPKIPRNYRLHDFQEGKRVCKEALQKELGLNPDPEACLIGFCGRLCFQKGVTLIMAAVDWMMQGQPNKCQLIIMGKGEPALSSQVADAESRFKGRVCGYVGFDPCVERRMMGGCDLLLMPSQFEPCGLPQMYAQMYGTLPVVHETGGLKDTVKGLWDDSHLDVATGWLFGGFSEGGMKHALYSAMDTFHHRREVFKKMQVNAMRQNFYWPTAMDEYERHVDYTLEDHPYKKPESWWGNH